MKYRNLSAIGLFLTLTLCMLAGAEAGPMNRLRNRSCNLMTQKQDEDSEEKAEIFDENNPGRHDMMTKREPFDEDAEDISSEDKAEKREQVAKRVETLLMWRLTEALDLNEQQGAKVFPIVKKYYQEIRQTMDARHKVKEDLRKAVKANSTENIKRLLDELTGLNDKIHKLQTNELTELKGVLNVTQLAKCVLFREEFDREIREMIFDARHRNGDRRPPKEDERGPAHKGNGKGHHPEEG